MTPLIPGVAPGLFNLAAAFVGGSVVGLERSYNGRVAGFRTHALVAIAAAAAMTVAYSPSLLGGLAPGSTAAGDATRLAQGVMTGVGFLGGGVIFKEGANIQGLTTAASIWATAAIGLLCGVGLWPTALAAAVLVVVVLTVMRYAEAWLPTRVRADGAFRFKADSAPDEIGFRRLLGGHGVVVSDLSYRLTNGGEIFEYRAQIEDRGGRAFDSLAQRLRASVPALMEFELNRISK
jgi:putative Mg2+ transporter-C (MgtC) family protein